jgi:GNAT superfamily N-acetyltransferase
VILPEVNCLLAFRMIHLRDFPAPGYASFAVFSSKFMNSTDPTVSLLPVPAIEWPRIREMAARIWPDAYGALITPEQIDYMLNQMYSDEAFALDQKNGVSYCWIQWKAERAGFLAFGPAQTGKPCFLHKCYLETTRQGNGLGSVAMEHLIRLLQEKQVTALELRVNRGNETAIGFYRKNGFEVIGKDCLDIGNGFVMDDYLMQRRIGSA